MSRKKLTILIIAAVAVLAIGVSVTWAYLTASSAVSNVFTIGNVSLTLTETTGETYPLTPGTTLTKDPVLTVKAGSEVSWVFFTAHVDAELRNYVTYEIAAGWTPLDGYTDVYYRLVDAATADRAFALLKNHSVQVSETVTEEQLAAMTSSLKMNFTGYALQQDGIADPHQAWEILNEEVTVR